MTSPYDPEAVAKAMAGGVVGTLAALREENARLRAKVRRLTAEGMAFSAEVERLREALGEIARKECEPSCAVDRGPGLQTEWCNPCLARAALAPEVK